MVNYLSGLLSGRRGLRIASGVVLLFVIVAIFFFLTRRCDSYEVYVDDIPLPGVHGMWTDSVFAAITWEQKLHLLTMREITSDDLLPFSLPADAGGILFAHDSLHRYEGLRQLLSDSAIPAFTLTRNPCLLPGMATVLTGRHLLQVRSDSLAAEYLAHHLRQFREAGFNTVTYPLWIDRPHTLSLPDTFFLRRQGVLLRQFINMSVDMGLIPVLSLPEALLRENAPGLMPDSLLAPFWENIITPDLPAVRVTGMDSPGGGRGASLREMLEARYGFRGLIIRDDAVLSAAGMVLSVAGGADVVVADSMLTASWQEVRKRYDRDRQFRVAMDRAVRRVLLYKEWLMFRPAIDRSDGDDPMEATRTTMLRLALVRASIIRLHDSVSLIPFAEAGERGRYTLHLPAGIDCKEFTTPFGYFSPYNMRRYRPDRSVVSERGRVNILVLYGSGWPDSASLASFSEARGSVIVHVGPLETLTRLPDGVVVLHAPEEEISLIWNRIANILFGGVTAGGMIPYDLSGVLQGGVGEVPVPRIRLNHTIPEEAGLPGGHFSYIDTIVLEAIKNGTFPGCQVLIAKGGNVIFHKAYGTTVWDAGDPVGLQHLYDVASVTKVAATTLAWMKMTETGRMHPDHLLGRYFINTTVTDGRVPADTLIQRDTIVVRATRAERERRLQSYDAWEALNDTLFVVTDTLLYRATRAQNVFRIPLRQLLTHRSGLPPALPISRFVSTHDRQTGVNRYREIFSPVMRRDTADIMVARDMFLYRHYFDTLWAMARNTGVNPQRSYVYSDANMVFLQQAIDSVNRMPLDRFLAETFYGPMGLRHCLFNPLTRFDPAQVVPTAVDMRWRRQLVHGTVHDPTAALFGGVAGNAGLFSNAHDLAVIGQMLLNHGEYGGRRYLDSATVASFTGRQDGVHRAMGFDMPASVKTIIAPSASPRSYGHTGFTGTCIWIDPDNEIVFVFLSNRIHPNTENQKINFFKVRERVHQVVYDAMAASLRSEGVQYHGHAEPQP